MSRLFNEPISFSGFSFFVDPPRERVMDPAREFGMVIRNAQAVADRAILIIDELVKKSFYVIGLGAGIHLSTLAADVTEFAVATGLTPDI